MLHKHRDEYADKGSHDNDPQHNAGMGNVGSSLHASFHLDFSIVLSRDQYFYKRSEVVFNAVI